DATLKSRNGEQAASDRNEVFDQSNVEIGLAFGLYEPRAGLIAGETTDGSADHSETRTKVSRLSSAKRNAGTSEATGHDAADKPWRSSASRSVRQLVIYHLCDG